MSLGQTADKLRELGVETVGVVATPADRARLYFRYRPPRYLVGADPDLTSHRAFGLPRTEVTEEIQQIVGVRVEGLAREVGLTAPPGGGWAALDRADGIDPTEHQADFQRHQAQFIGQFLINRDGVIHWANVECERDGLEGLDNFPTDDELLAAVRSL